MTLLVGLGLGVGTLVLAAQPASAGPNHIATTGSTVAEAQDAGSISGDVAVNDGWPDAFWWEGLISGVVVNDPAPYTD